MWEITALARLVRIGGKTSIVEFIFSKVVNQKSEAITNNGMFAECFLGNFTKLFKTV